ncbi:HepT-like ribonuclease domain-containing protein [Xanthomonas graminis]|uniref:DUF86 domain-containing protein n=1 Tax=Xanthomonas graminis pv. phlei TaxID=487906 RepID=A0A0K2ZUU3_9XANT|nr:DUF86 domain-containing protein [Xanthomonas translucens]UKE64920.1 DUF86 domain-containing protein [Xanthomonas translucens pv. phlei]UKE74291.1 DUF86 domain-containing protein [Xanthomonas translucens pv. phleipratensis]CTP87170.1 hypothetical protein XTPLMG730_1718 [Xanthomonas translucens pv. phlei]
MKHPERRLHHYLGDILNAVERIEKYVKDMQDDDFLASDLVQDAVVRNFEIIGEASKHILQRFPDFANAHSELQLVQAYEMRNFVTHGYQHVDYEVVLKTIRHDLPVLGQRIAACRSALTDNAD